MQTIPSTPSDFTGYSTGAEIAVDRAGRNVYVSNRGHDSIGVFAIDPAKGTLAPRQWVPTHGGTPRFFAFDPAQRFLYVANQGGHSIVGYRVGRDGQLAPTPHQGEGRQPGLHRLSVGAVPVSDKTYGFETLSVHAGAAPDPTTGARALPIYQTTAYVFEDADHAAALFNLQTVGFIYSRLTNPTNAALETRLATLEGGRGCTVASSGHAAQVLALFPLMAPGDEIVASSRLYGGSLQQMRNTYPKFGWTAKIVDADEPENFKRAVTRQTPRPSSSRAWPIRAASSATSRRSRASPRQAGVPLLVDNTLATPWLCKPIDYGATLIVHSTTKFLSGNGTSMGGAIVDSGKFDWAKSGKFPSLAGPEPAYHGLNFFETFGDMAYTFHSHAVGLRDLGPSQAPFNAWLTMLGIETLGLRMERHCANAQKVAE